MTALRTVGVICNNCGTFLPMGDMTVDTSKFPDRTAWVKPAQITQPVRCTNPECRHTFRYEYQDLVAVPPAERP